MDVSTNIGCKNMCSYCPQEKIISRYKGPKMMELNDFKKCVNKIPKNIRITFAGMAEPFFNNKCMEMIEYVHKEGYELEIYTTLMGMNPNFVKILEKIPLAYFEIHLPDDSNRTKMKVNKTYLKTLKEIKNSKIKNIHYQVFGKVHPKAQEILKFEVEDLSRILRSRAGNVKGFKEINHSGKLICPIAGKFLKNNALLPNGDVFLCSMDYGLEYKLGNLLSSPYESFFKSEAFKRIQNAMNSQSGEVLCRHCAYAKKINSPKYIIKKMLEKIGLLDLLYLTTKNKTMHKIYLLFYKLQKK